MRPFMLELWSLGIASASSFAVHMPQPGSLILVTRLPEACAPRITDM